mmetsp:Transcript_34057/g.45004  ORF Transcript_34057/g.45004 Transcript_34057/m.45004 type:complete len:654 (+) Transcript_34057:103-2064(+)
MLLRSILSIRAKSGRVRLSALARLNSSNPGRQALQAAAGSSSEESSGFWDRYSTTLKVAGALTAGYMLGQADMENKKLTFPSATRGTCCEGHTLTEAQATLPEKLKSLVGESNVLGGTTTQYTKGSRLGHGTALAIARPGTLAEAIQVLEACVAAGVAIVPQGANTGLTGGSVPRDTLCDRPTVVINMRRLTKIVPIGSGEKVLCFAGAGIFTLAQELAKINRDSHSALGSIFLDPSVAAGVSFGSGGTQIRKGPVYTERVLYCKVSAEGKVEVVDQLGLKAKNTDDLLAKLESGSLTEADMDEAFKGVASDTSYPEKVCKLDKSVSRYNADLKGPDPCRSEGKVFLLASIHDTFPLPKKTELVWASCKDFETAQDLKAKVLLDNPKDLPQSCEYMDRDTFDCVDSSGRILIKVIELVGMKHLGKLWDLKLMIEGLPLPFMDVICDKLLYWFNWIIPEPISKPLMVLGKEYDHHMMIEMSEFGGGELERLKKRFAEYVESKPAGTVEYHVCDTKEVAPAKYFRFVVAPAFRTMCVGTNVQGLSLDYSLPKNERAAPVLPESVAEPVKRLRYSHFGCNVVHEDIAFAPGVDVHGEKMKIKKIVEGLAGKLPAEHGHGTEYKAPADTQQRWMKMDPTNTMNPGVGGLSYTKDYDA